jgi:hypothetical protein
MRKLLKKKNPNLVYNDGDLQEKTEYPWVVLHMLKYIEKQIIKYIQDVLQFLKFIWILQTCRENNMKFFFSNVLDLHFKMHL